MTCPNACPIREAFFFLPHTKRDLMSPRKLKSPRRKTKWKVISERGQRVRFHWPARGAAQRRDRSRAALLSTAGRRSGRVRSKTPRDRSSKPCVMDTGASDPRDAAEVRTLQSDRSRDDQFEELPERGMMVLKTKLYSHQPPSDIE
ncbi:hypothetical protein EVAR_80531_1 [Eumeta japonica]|uniref:Uncharacterized protein n=1 Tax=Eumeta variegata TaxID=151549 RepID=A0A4C1TLH3_EUMVA|nr:hypothetical protein EVAR_80531_1 [Eumeta japonica]